MISRPAGCRLDVLLFVGIFVASAVHARDFYIDPVSGSPAGDGSAGNPWRTLQEVVEADLIETREWESFPYEPGLELVVVNPGAPVTAGDTLWLRTGYHGELDISRAYNSEPITIAAELGHAPRLGSVALISVQNWVVRGVSISPFHASPPVTPGTIVRVEDHSFSGPAWDVEVADCDIFTVDDASGWGAPEWINLAASGVSVTGTRVTIRDSTVRNVRFGISASGEEALISSNVIDGFSADGMRGLGDGSIYEGNRVQNCYVGSSQGDPNHDDGFQSWSVGPGGPGTGEVRDVVLRGNTFINYLDATNPLVATMQGIGCFDGLYVNWVVENNTVVTDHWHGITLLGARDSLVINNSVIDVNETSPGPPWIMIGEDTAGPSEDVVVRNNLATQIILDGVDVTGDHNIEFSDSGSLFVAPPYDLHLLAQSAAVDTGTAVLAPSDDIEGTPRPQGPEFDVGAYEFCVVCVLFSDGFETGTTSAWSSVVP